MGDASTASTAADVYLTLGRLTHEHLLRAAAPAIDADLAARRVAWCLPWADAVESTATLDDVLVYARSDQLDPAGLRTLARRNAVAVVVAGAEDADLTGPLPALAAPARVSYRELNHLVAELELAREAHVMRYGITVHHALVDLLYRGAGLAALCHQIARLSGCTTAVLDPHFRVLAFEQSRDRVFEPASVAASLRALDLTTPEQDDLIAVPRVCPVQVGEVRATAVINAILLAGRHDGWVAIIEPGEAPHPHDLAQHRVVLEQGAAIVGTELLRMRSVEQAEERARGDFIHALLHGRFSTQHDLEARAAHYDFPVDAVYGVVAATLRTDSAESLTALFQLARDAARLLPGPSSRTLATVAGNVLVTIRQIGTASTQHDAAAADKALAAYATALQHELTNRTRLTVSVAYSRPVFGAGRIFDGYREARLALALQVRLGMTQTCSFHDLRVFAVLAELATNPVATAFTHDLLAPLRDARTGGGDLEQVVSTYIAHGGNLNAAARALHVHRNTMLYKIARASKLLHLDLREAEDQFTIWLAQKMDLLAETSAMIDRDLRP